MSTPLVVPTPRRGYKTSELYAVLAPIVLTALTLVFHRDFSGYVQAAGIVGSGLAAGAYAIGRAHLKRPTDLASAWYDLQALAPVAQELAPVVQNVVAVLPVALPPPTLHP